MPKRGPLDSAEIPQANQLSKLLDMIRAASRAEPLGPDLMPRDRAYYVHASKLLGLLDDDDEITSLGRIVVGLESEQVRTAVLCEAFKQTAVVQRWMKWAHVTRIRQLDPMTAGDFLVEESDLGEATAERRGLTLRKWWSELCGGPEQRESVRPPAPAIAIDPEQLTELDWDALGKAIDPHQSSLPLSRFDLPARMCTFAQSEELETLGDLLALRRDELLEYRNLGRTSIESSRRAIVEKLKELARDGGASPELDLDVHDNLFALLRTRLGELSPQHRLVLTNRIGVQGRAMTLEELGSLLGVTRERVRQLERDALGKLTRDDSWLEALSARLKSKLSAGAIALSELARDRWFGEVDTRVSELRFVVERMLEADLAVFDIGDATMLVNAAEVDVREAEQRLRSALKAARYPMSTEDFEHLARASTNALPEGVAASVLRSFDQDLQKAEGPRGVEVVAFGSTRQKQLLAFVRASDKAVSVRDLEERFGRGPLPDSVIHVGRGQVWVADRVPAFDTWRDRLTPLCIALMQTEDVERQWAAYELLEELRGKAQIPDWLNYWHLSSMLRESDQLMDLGRLRFRLGAGGAPEERVHVREIALDELTKAGAPIAKDQLLSRIKQRGALSDLAVAGLLSRLPFVMVAADKWGLVERDVPGGADAFAEAMQGVEDALRTRGKGLSSVESTAFVRALSPQHARWSAEMVRSLARAGAVLRGSANGAIGLTEWDDVRVPSQAGLMRELIDAGGGRALLADVQRRIAEVHGAEPTAAQVANLAQSVEARVRHGEVIDITLASRVSIPASAMPLSVDEIAGVPDASRPMLAEILAKPLGDVEDMREQVARHVARFEAAARTNEFLDVREMRQLSVGCQRLLDALANVTNSHERALIHAAVEYFIAPVDAEADLEIGGLDDDVAVFNSIVRKIGWDDHLLAV